MIFNGFLLFLVLLVIGANLYVLWRDHQREKFFKQLIADEEEKNYGAHQNTVGHNPDRE